MKHIIPYLQSSEYNVGDYIVYRIDYNNKPSKFKKAKLISINKYVTSPYKILNEDDIIMSLLPTRIVRKLTDKEKEEYIIKKDSDKYNL